WGDPVALPLGPGVYNQTIRILQAAGRVNEAQQVLKEKMESQWLASKKEPPPTKPS
ncbi:unnamed protein product, partial [Heterosigma akashiwo]